jgi:hypothetical protein
MSYILDGASSHQLACLRVSLVGLEKSLDEVLLEKNTQNK